MYSTNAVSRPEISEVLEEASDSEKFYIGQKIFPVKGVKARAGRYPRIKIASGNLMRRDVTKRNSTGTYNEISRKHSWDGFDCEDRGLEERIDDTKREEMSNFFDLEALTGRQVKRQLLIDFEINVAGEVMSTANFAKENPKVDYTEANIDTVDVPYDLELAIERLHERAVDVNTMVMSRRLFNYIRRSTLLQNYIYGRLNVSTQSRRAINAQDLAEVFSIENVFVATATYDTSNRGSSSASLSQIWGTSYIWLGKVASGGFEAGGVGRTLVWDADVSDGLYQTETYRDEKRRGDMLRVRTNAVEKVIDETAGQLIQTNFSDSAGNQTVTEKETDPLAS